MRWLRTDTAKGYAIIQLFGFNRVSLFLLDFISYKIDCIRMSLETLLNCVSSSPQKSFADDNTPKQLLID